MTIATIVLAVIGVAVCIWGIIKDNPSLHSLGILVAAISLVLAIIRTM
jgi:hypothetical protein